MPPQVQIEEDKDDKSSESGGGVGDQDPVQDS